MGAGSPVGVETNLVHTLRRLEATLYVFCDI